MVRFVSGKENQRVLWAPSDHNATLMLNGRTPALGVSVRRSANAPVSARVGGNGAPSLGGEGGICSVVLATRAGAIGCNDACNPVTPSCAAANTSQALRSEPPFCVEIRTGLFIISLFRVTYSFAGYY